MKIFNVKSLKFLAIAFASFCFVANPLFAEEPQMATSLSEYLQKCPWIGLVAKTVTLGPITISDVAIHNGDKLAVAKPGEHLNGMLHYEIDSKDLETLHLYHLVIGIKGQGAQDCVTHNLGIWDSEGNGHFSLVAPEKPGVYEVRFLFVQDMTCQSARDAWDSQEEAPTAAATIGIVIVK